MRSQSHSTLTGALAGQRTLGSVAQGGWAAAAAAEAEAARQTGREVDQLVLSVGVARAEATRVRSNTPSFGTTS